MRVFYRRPKFKFYIGDVRNYESVHAGDARSGLRFPCRGAQAGALLRVLSHGSLADEHAGGRERDERGHGCGGVKNVIVLSTDKAVYPINAMGMSKAMMEKLMVAKARMSVAEGHTSLRHPLWQRDGLARLGYSAIHSNRSRRANHHRD